MSVRVQLESSFARERRKKELGSVMRAAQFAFYVACFKRLRLRGKERQGKERKKERNEEDEERKKIYSALVLQAMARPETARVICAATA